MTANTSPLALPTSREPCLAIPPPPPHHPLRWRRVWQLLRSIGDAEDQVEAGLQLFDAVGGLGGERTFQRFAAHPEARRWLRERPDLIRRLADRQALAALPEHSLGRAYLAFAERNGFAADGLVAKSRTVEREGVAEQDVYRRWFWDRYTLAHDLWHVVTGCDASPEGESRLLAFSYAQTPQRGYAALLGLIAFRSHVRLRAHLRQWRCWRAGRRARPLLFAAWESLLAQPLDEVRRELNVSAPLA